jgi:hypothetical protein
MIRKLNEKIILILELFTEACFVAMLFNVVTDRGTQFIRGTLHMDCEFASFLYGVDSNLWVHRNYINNELIRVEVLYRVISGKDQLWCVTCL